MEKVKHTVWPLPDGMNISGLKLRTEQKQLEDQSFLIYTLDGILSQAGLKK